MVDSHYVAFGLSLRSAFPLPGMVPEEGEGLPSIELEIVTPARLRSAWSGELRTPSWRGRLGGGGTFTIGYGVDGDLLFAFGDRVRFRLDPEACRLQCAPQARSDLDWQRVLLTRVLPSLALARGREALHAGAVASPIGVVGVAAPSGTGKSTLAAELMRRGWPLFCDDVLVLAPGAAGVEAHPGSPHVNLACGDGRDSAPPGVTLGLHAGERWMAVEEAARSPRPLAALFLLERGPGLRLGAERLPASPLHLAPYMLGLPDERSRDPRREAERFALYSELIGGTAVFRLSGGTDDGPAALADTVERSLGRSADLPMRGAA